VLDELMPLVEARARLARNTLAFQCDASLYVPVRRDLFKFALLNILTAVHERLGENGGTLTLSCEAAQDEVLLDITALAEPAAAPLAPADAGYERSLGVATALLDSSGVSLQVLPEGVRLRLPRVNQLDGDGLA
jgi:hypothetical protein